MQIFFDEVFFFSFNSSKKKIIIFQLLQGLDKYRGENSILIWDITRSMYQNSALDAVSSFERRSTVFQLEQLQSTTTKPVVEFGIILYFIYLFYFIFGVRV